MNSMKRVKTGTAACFSINRSFQPTISLAVAIIALAFALDADTARCQIVGASQQKVFVHYMPWYAAEAKLDSWGWHWTMNHFDPSKIDDRGRREIASHDYPLIGPYDSGDPHVLEYHVLLMKIAGIDGVIFDWYGTRNFRDYAMINRNTEAMISWLEKANLSFTFCYEDQSIKHLILNEKLPAKDDIQEFAEELKKLASSHFKNEKWLRINGKPALLIFGPQHFNPDSWAEAIRQSGQNLFVAGLPHLAKEFELDGGFAWPPVTGGKKIAARKWKQKLQQTYANFDSENMVPVVFPKFHDIYAQAKLHDSYGYLDDRNGKTFQESFAMARETRCPLIQIATWNDYGEGTQIEPGRESGYQYLEHLVQTDNDSSAKVDDLRLPLELFKRRKSGDENSEAIATALFAGDLAIARQLLGRKRD